MCCGVLTFADKKVDSDPTTQRNVSGAFYSESSSFWSSIGDKAGKKRALKTALSPCSNAKITLRLWQSKHAPAASQGRVEFLLSFVMFDVCLKAFKALIEGCQMCSGIFFFLKTQIYVFETLGGGGHNPQKGGRKHTLQLDTVRKLDWAMATTPACPSIWPQTH